MTRRAVSPGRTGPLRQPAIKTNKAPLTPRAALTALRGWTKRYAKNVEDGKAVAQQWENQR